MQDASNFTFNLPGGSKDEEFLRDYLVNRRWKPSEDKTSSNKRKKVDSEDEEGEDRDEELGNMFIKPKTSAVPFHHPVVDQPLLTEEAELKEDDQFLTKARRFEHRWNTNDEELDEEYPNTSAARFRFEEEDKDFVSKILRCNGYWLKYSSADYEGKSWSQ